MAQKIRDRYTEKQATALDELRALDKKVRRPAAVFSYVFGSISAVIMGCGMSLIMTDIGTSVGIGGNHMVLGTVIGSVGLILALLNYPLYKRILNRRKRKYASEILKRSDSIMNQ